MWRRVFFSVEKVLRSVGKGLLCEEMVLLSVEKGLLSVQKGLLCGEGSARGRFGTVGGCAAQLHSMGGWLGSGQTSRVKEAGASDHLQGAGGAATPQSTLLLLEGAMGVKGDQDDKWLIPWDSLCCSGACGLSDGNKSRSRGFRGFSWLQG